MNALDNRRKQGYIDGATSPAETGYSTSRKPLSGFGFAPPCEAYAELVDVATAKSYLRGGFFSATFPDHRDSQYPAGPDAGSGPGLHPGGSNGCARTYPYRHAGADRCAATDGHAGTYPYRYAATDGHARTYRYRYAATDGHVGTYSDGHARTYPDADPYPDAYTHAYSDLDANAGSYPYADSGADADGHAYPILAIPRRHTLGCRRNRALGICLYQRGTRKGRPAPLG